jgi:hypothetical protein
MISYCYLNGIFIKRGYEGKPADRFHAHIWAKDII